MHLFYRSKKRTRNIYSVVAKKVWCNDAIVLACSYFSGNDEEKTGTCSSAGAQPSSNIFSWFSTSASSIHPFSAPQSGKKVPFIGRRSEFLWNSFPPFFSRGASLQTSNSIPPSLFLSQDGKMALCKIRSWEGEKGGERREASLAATELGKRKGERCCWHRPCPTRRKTLSPPPLLFFFFKGRVAIVENRDQKASDFTAMQTALIPARKCKGGFFPLLQTVSVQRAWEGEVPLRVLLLPPPCVSLLVVLLMLMMTRQEEERGRTRDICCRRQGKEKKTRGWSQRVCSTTGGGRV